GPKLRLSPAASGSAGVVTVTEATGAGAITTIWADPLLPSLVAVRTVDPGFNARTRGQLSDHAVSMRATVESLSVKLTARPYSGFPCASRSATWKRAVSPTIMVSVEGVTVTEATGGGADTSTSAEPLFPSLVAVTVGVPGSRARSCALWPAVPSMRAMLESLMLHVTDERLSGFPWASRGVAMKLVLSPAATVSAG